MNNILKKSIMYLQTAAVIISMPLSSSYALESELKDSGIDYTEVTDTINNPGAGYTSTVWAVCKPGNTPVYSPTSNLVLFFIDIGNFSSGANGTKDDEGNYVEGVDYDLDSAFFDSWDKTLQNCYNNGCMAALRFRYDANGKDNPEPASFEQVLHHIDQIKESGLLEKYSDIIAYVESGFVGKWGEQHGGKYTSVQYKAQVLEAMLQTVPAQIPVTVRTPDIFAEWIGIKRSELADTELINSITESTYSVTIQENKDRVGLYDDGYMGSNSDLGTYANREIETDWLHNQTFTSYFGGEFSGNLEFAQKYDTYLPENSIPEMYKTHLSYINSNIFKLYNDYIFSENYVADISADNSAYYGQTVHKFMRDHLGYRFVIRDSKLTSETTQGENIDVDFKIENTGFAGVIPSVRSYVILEKDGVYIMAESDTDCREWKSCTISDECLKINLPDNIPAGDWNVYLKLSMGTDANIKNMNCRGIRFANDDIWNGSLGANFLGSVSIKESETQGTNNTMIVNEVENETPSVYYSVGNNITVDGVLSSPYEWKDIPIAGTNDTGIEMYTCADEEYLYIMSNVPKGESSAPVYNLQFNMGDANGERYWIYFQSNGFVYFNHGDHTGCQCKWSDDMVEFKLPLKTIDAEGMSEIDLANLRIFLQDSGNDWKLMSDIKIPEYTVKPDFSVFSTYTNVNASEGESYSYTVLPNLTSVPSYEWYLNGEIIPEQNSETISLENITKENKGEYSVKITSASGIEKTVTAFNLNVTKNETDLKKGDVNLDGKVTVADAVMLQKWLVNIGKLDSKENADVCEDEVINIFDLASLKNILIEN